ncbi:hypothetical protein SAMN02745131_01939 [Flavisolibacter ginsengisoli DSM 18119]|jgi:hypothetical protein|uniref:Uncharacterized protein n=1 Tax=Flavisolibacter ginsengisoli DSM 18119 TaxID=1121884 RepID=A0A1M4ZGZ7_9BACT|nr:hypothetical protein SAMN02745131_01939 [Flavisolibacter ginsengisoli DSM 18119]
MKPYYIHHVNMGNGQNGDDIFKYLEHASYKGHRPTGNGKSNLQRQRVILANAFANTVRC